MWGPSGFLRWMLCKFGAKEMTESLADPQQTFPKEILPALRCVQCGKCSSGCPVAFETRHTPRKVMRFLQWGWVEEAGRSPFLELCAQCQTCTVRCPRGIQVSEIVLAIRRLARAREWLKEDGFHRSMEKMIRERGRISELRLGLAAQLGRMPIHPLEDLILLLQMLLKGKLR